jgi:hypothetical protein
VGGMPKCPYCNGDISRLYSDARFDFVWFNNRWLVDFVDEEVVVCPNCYEEMSPKELIDIGLPRWLIK